MAGNPRLDDLRKRLEKEPGSRLFAQLAEELRKEGDLSEAIELCRSGLERHPSYPAARITLGRALLDTGEYEGARVEFETVLKAAPDNILASRYLGDALEALGDVEGARQRHRLTLALSPGDKHVLSRLEALDSAEESRTAPAVAAGGQPRPDAAPSPAEVELPPVPVADAEETFELERPWDVPVAAPSPRSDTAAETEPEPWAAGAGSEPDAEPAAGVPPEPESFEMGFDEPMAPAKVPAEAEPRVPLAADEEPQALASPTLAELYLNQGFARRAVEVYRQFLAREPENEKARARLAEIEGTLSVTGPGIAEGGRERAERTIGRLEQLRQALGGGRR